jgi:hypothetical protein
MHEWNRTSDFMSILGNIFEFELRNNGPDAICRDDDEKDVWDHKLENTDEDHHVYIHTSMPDNVKIILTGNPAKDDFLGETQDFMEDPALKSNRLVGARVQHDKIEYKDPETEEVSTKEPSLGPESFPGGVIVHNYINRLEEENIDWAKEIVKEKLQGLMPGKQVSELIKLVKRRRDALDSDIWDLSEDLSGPSKPQIAAKRRRIH